MDNQNNLMYSCVADDTIKTADRYMIGCERSPCVITQQETRGMQSPYLYFFIHCESNGHTEFTLNRRCAVKVALMTSYDVIIIKPPKENTAQYSCSFSVAYICTAV